MSIISYYGKQFFDYIFIFSDHGCRLTNLKSQKNKHIIDRDRIKTLMYMKTKMDTEIKIDYNLRSNLDLFPTIAEIIGEKPRNQIEGISLLSDKGHGYVMIEDHNTFGSNMGQIIEHWATVTKDGVLHWIDANGIWEHEINEERFDNNYFSGLLTEKMSDFEFCRSFYDILNMYKDYRLPKDYLSSGQKIKKSSIFKYATKIRFLWNAIKRMGV